jgi:hypothetical protein
MLIHASSQRVWLQKDIHGKFGASQAGVFIERK